MTTGQLQRVVMRGFPLHLYVQSRAHSEALIREFAFIAQSGQSDADSEPCRLLEGVDAIHARFADVLDAVQRHVEEAIGRGEIRTDLELDVPSDLAAAVVELARTFDAADEFCRNGDLLTVAAPGPIREFRRWYAAQFERQIAGEPLTAWPEWRG